MITIAQNAITITALARDRELQSYTKERHNTKIKFFF